MPLSPPPPTPPSLAVNDEDLLPILIKTSPPPGAVTPPDSASSSDSEQRARSRSRSPTLTRSSWKTSSDKVNDRLSPPSFGGLSASNAGGSAGGVLSGWRSISRSPSPMGLIPIHKTFSSFIHRHEVPRKVLHVSIGFLVLHLYRNGVQPSAITPYLGYALIPIASADVLRFVSPSFNWFYIRVLGALMRETEYSGWNGVIWYLVGTWTVLTVFPKDIATLSVLLLSWCDTAASTFGRLYGRYTPRIRKNKSLAGSLAAMMVGAASAAVFYGIVVPTTPLWEDDPVPALSFFDKLGVSGWGYITGGLALSVMSVVTGLIGAGSEVVDIWGLDDNVVIPIVSAVGIYGFLKVFGLQ